MKLPKSNEEYLVWPPMGAGILLFVSATIVESVHVYNKTAMSIEGGYLLAFYLFPILMGIGVSIRLHGKYWLGFSWLAFLTYICCVVIRHLSVDGALGYVYTVLFCCTIIFVMQSVLLYLKRISYHFEKT